MKRHAWIILGWLALLTAAQADQPDSEQEQYKAHIVSRMYEATYGGQEKCRSDKEALDRLNKMVDQFRHAYPELMSSIENSPYLPQAKEHLKLGRDPSGKYDLQECRETETILRQMLIVPQGQQLADYYVQILKGKDRSSAEAELFGHEAEKNKGARKPTGAPPKPPLIVPFEAQKAGSTFTTELQVVEHRYYEFAVLLQPKKGATIEDVKQLIALAEGEPGYRNGEPISYGIAIFLTLVVSAIDQAGERIVYSKSISREQMTSAGGMGVEKLIDVIELKPGNYRIRIQSLKDIPELIGYPINFGIYGKHNTNPID